MSLFAIIQQFKADYLNKSFGTPEELVARGERILKNFGLILDEVAVGTGKETLQQVTENGNTTDVDVILTGNLYTKSFEDAENYLRGKLLFKYIEDFSSLYDDRTLIDKGYLDTRLEEFSPSITGKNIDGGSASSIYLISQNINGGGA